ncbi:hypothetical protein L211DRAFT_832223 [Terfezia boudieri ATCC MYA-4762]|uniref:Uncharacterized protein n=1 Tax=Terfezia boudieri ATCC MYA-4762 TaxID=1051890 RepID=A0A3N4M391_9PEZI|nr:hypothetical protein L211DRAFT_832223 [Terfezia boudieri ATCC MYA-4762]
MDDDSTEPKKRKVATKYKQSYSKMTVKEAQARLGFNIDLLFHDAIVVKHMLEQGSSTLEGLKPDVIAKIKETASARGSATKLRKRFIIS